MSNTLSKVLSIFLYTLLAICAVLFILYIAEEVSTEIMMYWMYILLILAVASAVIFPIIHLIFNPKGGIKTFITIVLLIAFVGIAYSLASDEVLRWPNSTTFYRKLYSDIGNEAELWKQVSTMSVRVGTGIITTYILVGLVVLSIVYTEISKFFR